MTSPPLVTLGRVGINQGTQQKRCLGLPRGGCAAPWVSRVPREMPDCPRSPRDTWPGHPLSPHPG